MSTSRFASPYPSPSLPFGTDTAHRAGALAGLQRFCTPVVMGLTIVIFAAALRLIQLGEPSLTGHEARQVNATYQDGYAQPRSLPILIGLMNRTIAGLSGHSEFAVRLPYALAGVLCVALLFGFCRRHLDTGVAVLAAGVAAVHPVLLTSSRSIGLGSLEAMFAVALLWAGLSAYSKPTRRSLVTFVAVSLAALACTFTSVLLIAAWLPMLLWATCQPASARDQPARLWPSSIACLACLVAAGWAWLWWLNAGPNAQPLSRAHEVPFRIWPWGFALAQLTDWGADLAWGIMGYARTEPWLGKPLTWIVVGLSLLATVWSLGPIWQRCRALLGYAVLLAVAIGLALTVDHPSLQVFNTLVFLFPLICILVGAGLVAMVQRGRRVAVTLALIVGLLLLPGQQAVRASIIQPAKPQHLRPIFGYIADHRQPGDAVFVWHEAVDAFYFYWHHPTTPVHLQPPEDATIHVQFRRGDFLKQLDDLVAQHGRVWLVFMHGQDPKKMSYLTRLKQYVTDFGIYRIVDEYTVGDASAHLLQDDTY